MLKTKIDIKDSGLVEVTILSEEKKCCIGFLGRISPQKISAVQTTLEKAMDTAIAIEESEIDTNAKIGDYYAPNTRKPKKKARR